mmetsp:Transcript_1637/g.2453  ORF Transcript_1637/g.2453 Transcript_1637/m.2453 type:complete len:1051 (+) Transcript_1637:18-3170(+)
MNQLYIILWITVLITLLLNIVPIKGQHCAEYTDCLNCTKLLHCTWCSMEQKCLHTQNRSSCFSAEVKFFEIQQSLESYKQRLGENFLGPQYTNLKFNRTPVELCQKRNLYDEPEQCPMFYLKLDSFTNVQNGAVLTDPIYPSKRINIFNRSHQLAREVPMNSMTVVPGMYFIKKPKYNREIQFFSINHDALKNSEIPLTKLYFLSYVMSETYKFFSFVDVSIDGPQGDYEVGYAAAIRYNNTLQCLYTPSPTTIKIESNLYAFVAGLDNILTNSISIVGWTIGAIFLLVLILKNKLNIRTPNGTIISSERNFKTRFSSLSKFKIVRIIVSIFYATNDNIIRYCGAEAYMFLTFEKSILVAIFFMAIVSLIILPFDLIHEYSTMDIASWSIAALNPGSLGRGGSIPQNPLVSLHFFGYWCYLVILFGLGIWFNNMAKYDIRVSHSISHRVLHILGVQKSILSESQLSGIFRSLYQQSFQYAFIAYNLEKLHPLVEKKNRLEMDIAAIRQYNLKNPEKRKKIMSSRFLRCFCCLLPARLFKSGVTDALSYKREMLEDVEQEIRQFRNSPKVEGTGSIFVVFKDEESMEKAKKDFSSDSFKLSVGQVDGVSIRNWYTKKAPHANDIAWENLGVSKWEARFLSLRTIVSIIMLMLITAGTVSLAEGSNSFKKVGQQVVEYAIESIFYINVSFENLNIDNAIKYATGIRTILFSLPGLLTFVNILVLGFTRTTIVGARLPNYRKKEKKELMLGMISIFLNTFVLGQIFQLFFGKIVSFTTDSVIYEFIILCKYFYQFSTYVLVVFKFLEMIFFVIAPLIVQKIKYGKWIRTYIPNFYVGTYSLRMMFFLMVAVWGPIIPLGPILMFFFMGLTYLIDRFMIFHFYHSTREYDGRIYEMLGKTMTWTVFIYPLYVMISCLRYYNSKYFIIFALLMAITSIVFTCILYGLSVKTAASKPVVSYFSEVTEDYIQHKLNQTYDLEGDILQEEEEDDGSFDGDEEDDLASLSNTQFVPGKEVMNIEVDHQQTPLEDHLNKIEFTYQHPLKKYYVDGSIEMN